MQAIRERERERASEGEREREREVRPRVLALGWGLLPPHPKQASKQARIKVRERVCGKLAKVTVSFTACAPRFWL